MLIIVKALLTVLFLSRPSTEFSSVSTKVFHYFNFKISFCSYKTLFHFFFQESTSYEVIMNVGRMGRRGVGTEEGVAIVVDSN